MKPKASNSAPQDDHNIISLQHPLVRLAERIDWEGMNSLLGEYYEHAVVGQPPKPTCLMAGLLYLKHTFAFSDEELIARWVESAHWQYFCDETYFQHEPPIHPTSLTRHRQRLGASGCEELLQLTIEAGVPERVIEERDLVEVLVDTTVMEKAITYPTDSKLYLKSPQRLNRQAKAHGIALRQSCKRTGWHDRHARPPRPHAPASSRLRDRILALGPPRRTVDRRDVGNGVVSMGNHGGISIAMTVSTTRAPRVALTAAAWLVQPMFIDTEALVLREGTAG